MGAQVSAWLTRRWDALRSKVNAEVMDPRMPPVAWSVSYEFFQMEAVSAGEGRKGLDCKAVSNRFWLTPPFTET